MEEFIKSIMPILIVCIITITVAKITGFVLRIILIGIIILVFFYFIKNNAELLTPALIYLSI